MIHLRGVGLLKPTLRRMLLLGVLVPLLGVFSSCSEGTGLSPTSEEPFLYVVLATEPFQGSLSDSVNRALLLTTGTPIMSPYRTAQSFEMRRVTDDALFAWRHEAMSRGAPPIGFREVSMSQGNYVLAEAGSAAGLGRRDLRPGESYSLLIVTDGRTVSGRVTIPESPRPALLTTGGTRRVSWPRVNAAGGYRIETNTERFGPTVGITPDTSVELHFDGMRPLAPEIRVTAMDSNLYRYITDPTLARAGISGAFGVLGAVGPAARLLLPNDP